MTQSNPFSSEVSFANDIRAINLRYLQVAKLAAVSSDLTSLAMLRLDQPQIEFFRSISQDQIAFLARRDTCLIGLSFTLAALRNTMRVMGKDEVDGLANLMLNSATPNTASLTTVV